MSLSPEERRHAVARALERATDFKLLSGGTHTARTELEEAWELALQSTRLPPPWPQLVAYRLAHVLMRANDDRLLERVRDLFVEATRGDILGPMPHIYLLAALNRLWAKSPSDARPANMESRIAATYRKASELTKNLPYVRNRPDHESFEGASIQHGIVNLLELSAYYLRQPYAPLEGVGGAYRDLGLGDDWFLVGPDPAMSAVHYPESLAVAELEARAEANPGALLFRLSDNRSVTGWKSGSSPYWRSGNETELRLLTALLERANWSRPDLLDRVFGDQGTDAAKTDHLKVAVSRTRTILGEVFGESGRNLIISGSAAGPARLSPDVIIFGAVHASTYLTP